MGFNRTTTMLFRASTGSTARETDQNERQTQQIISCWAGILVEKTLVAQAEPSAMSTVFDPFAESARWVVWRNEQRNGHTTKVPYSPHSGHARADDPCTWGTRSEAEARASQLVNGQGGGIGIELGDLGD